MLSGAKISDGGVQVWSTKVMEVLRVVEEGDVGVICGQGG